MGVLPDEFYVHEARMLGARIEAPCVNTVGALAVADPHARTLTLGFNLVNLNEATVEAMERAREGGPFTSWSTWSNVWRHPRLLTILIRVGALRFTGATKHVLLWEAHFLLAPKPRQSQQRTRDFLAQRALPARTGPAPANCSPSQTTPTSCHRSTHPLTDAFDEWELLGFPLLALLLLTEDAKAVVRGGVLARSPTASATSSPVPGDRQRDCDRQGRADVLRRFVDLEGAWLDTVHFPGVAREFPFGAGVYAVRGTVSESFGCLNVDAQRMERLATLPDPRYAENGVMPSGIDSGLSKPQATPKGETPNAGHCQTTHRLIPDPTQTTPPVCTRGVVE